MQVVEGTRPSAVQAREMSTVAGMSRTTRTSADWACCTFITMETV